MEPDFRAVLNKLGVGVFVCDVDGKLVFINDAALRLSGAESLDHLRGATSHPYRPPQVRSEDGALIPWNRLPLARALAGEEVVFETEVFDVAKRGTLVVRTQASPLRDETGKIVGAVKLALDVTREHELARVKDDFIRQVAHELKTPIAVIKANAEGVLGAGPPSPHHLHALIRGVDRMDGLINSLLDLLDLQGGFFSFNRSPTPLERIVAGAIQRLPERSQARVHVTASSPVRVKCDEARIRRALYAILDNALKYSPRGAPIDVTQTTTDGVVRLAVRDRGYGIPAEKRSHIFEKYFRAHAGTQVDTGGIGVGLFVAREIVQQHQGRLWFDSPDDGGTVFFLELPVDVDRDRPTAQCVAGDCDNQDQVPHEHATRDR